MLYSRNLLRSGTVIGSFKLDVGTVYNTSGKVCFYSVFVLFLISLFLFLFLISLFSVVICYDLTCIVSIQGLSVLATQNGVFYFFRKIEKEKKFTRKLYVFLWLFHKSFTVF